MSAYDIQPLEDAYAKLKNATKPLPAISDKRGPLVYELTDEKSLNGIDSNYKDKAGGGVHGD